MLFIAAKNDGAVCLQSDSPCGCMLRRRRLFGGGWRRRQARGAATGAGDITQGILQSRWKRAQFVLQWCSTSGATAQQCCCSGVAAECGHTTFYDLLLCARAAIRFFVAEDSYAISRMHGHSARITTAFSARQVNASQQLHRWHTNGSLHCCSSGHYCTATYIVRVCVTHTLTKWKICILPLGQQMVPSCHP